MTFNSLKEELLYVKNRNNIVKQLRLIAENKDFIEVETDYFENYEDFIQQNKRVASNQLVKFVDSTNTITLLRPDITYNIIKQAIPRLQTNELIKLFYIDTVFRYKKDGSINTIKQFGMEVINSTSIQDDYELIQSVIDIYNEFNIEIVLEIGNQDFINRLLNNITTDNNTRSILLESLSKKNFDKILDFIKTIDEGYQLIIKSLLFNPNDLRIIRDLIVTYQLDNNLLQIITDMITLQRQLNYDSIKFDLLLLAEYDYYTGITFKGFVDGFNKEITSGGRYTSNSQEEVPALGFTMDLKSLFKVVLS